MSLSVPPRGQVGIADLARIFATDGPELQRFVAGMLGYVVVEAAPELGKILAQQGAGSTGSSSQEPAAPVGPSFVPISEYPATPFWCAEKFKIVPRETPADRDLEAARRTLVPGDDDNFPRPKVPFLPLASDAVVQTTLRAASPSRECGTEIDVDRIIDLWCRGRLMEAVPRRMHKSWGRSIQVVADLARRLVPYREDQRRVVEALRKLYPKDRFRVVALPDGERVPRFQDPAFRGVPYEQPPPGSLLLVLGDLGALAAHDDRLEKYWEDWGRSLRERDVTPIALVPCHLNRVSPRVSHVWMVRAWELGVHSCAPGLTEKEAADAVDEVLVLLSFALSVEPQLIRFARRLLNTGRRDPGIEAIIWDSDAFLSRHPEGATLLSVQASKLRERLASQDRRRKEEMFQWVERFRLGEESNVWDEELVGLQDEILQGLIQPEKLRQAVARLEAERRKIVVATGDERPSKFLEAWHRWVLGRTLPTAWAGEAGRVLHEIWAIVHRDNPEAVPPTAANPAWLVDTSVTNPIQRERLVEILQMSGRILARPFRPGASAALQPGVSVSPMALIRTIQGRLKIEPFDDFWEGGVAPVWADRRGRDDFGPWVDLRVGTARQRLRWIPPGKFWMGSPEDEEGRYPDEGPRHEETITSGFWMFDTPCTQDLWQAVMGENPSYFKGADRPVENVVWNQIQEFLSRLSTRCSGLELNVPSEAQWEYACRAGTTTPRYRADVNEIAWCWENSQGETHPVGQLICNDWGLFDTLGNVFEWCTDGWTSDYDIGKRGIASVDRVFRGGSCDSGARYARASCRNRREPSNRLYYLGFRCVEFKAPGPTAWENKIAAEETGGHDGAGAEHVGNCDQPRGAGWINLDAPGMNGVSFAGLTSLFVSSDVEQVVLRATTLPKWASAIGRDKHGLCAEFTIEGKAAEPPTKRAARKKNGDPPEAPLSPVRQRLRWIPPGRFLMGSPLDEEGQYSWEQAPHELTIDQGFWMFATPCPQALWEALMGENPSRFRGANRPVESVSWEQCQEFLTALNSRLDGLRLSLPSEAQWEYACRAGTESVRYLENLDAIAWYGENSGNETHSVAEKQANSWGLYDMLGNVWEWCADVWESGRADKSNPSASAHHMCRGGSWVIDAHDVRAAYRYAYEPSYSSNSLGFRCAEFRQGFEGAAIPGSEAQGTAKL